MEKLDVVKFDAIISDIQPINPLFSKAKARILYLGKNRNGSYFSKETVERMIYSIFNIPVVGEYLVNKDDFGSHGGKIVIDSNGIEFIETTKPYGVVPSDSEIGWETITEDDGSKRDYLYCTLYLWTGRYPECKRVIESGNNQSMEIQIYDGEWIEDDSGGYYDIKDAIFSSLCILGEDVEPCFENSSIIGYSLNKDEFKKEFNEMLNELKASFTKEPEILEEGGTEEMNEKINLIEKFEISNVEKIEDLKTKLDSFTLEQLEIELYKLSINQKDETLEKTIGEVDELKNKISEYETNINDLNSKIETLTTSNEELTEYKVNIENAQKEAFEKAQEEKKTELISDFSKLLSVDEIKLVQDENLSVEDMETKFKLLFANKELSTKLNKKDKKTVEIPLVFNKVKSDNSWTSCIKK